MPFMITYGAINYSYFALAMSYDKQQEIQQERTIWHDTEDDSWKSFNEVEQKNKTVMSSYYNSPVPLPKQMTVDGKEYGTLNHSAVYSKQHGVKITINDEEYEEKLNNKKGNSLNNENRLKNTSSQSDSLVEDNDKEQLLPANNPDNTGNISLVI